MKKIAAADLIILDEWGYLPLHQDGARLLFEVVSLCYERKSVIITTNIEFSHWKNFLFDDKLTVAIIDRLIHHSHLLFYDRESYRKQHALIKWAKYFYGLYFCIFLGHFLYFTVVKHNGQYYSVASDSSWELLVKIIVELTGVSIPVSNEIGPIALILYHFDDRRNIALADTSPWQIPYPIFHCSASKPSLWYSLWRMRQQNLFKFRPEV